MEWLCFVLVFVASGLVAVIRLLARWCVCSFEGSVQSRFSPMLEIAFSWVHGTTVACHGIPQGHGTTVTSTAVIFYYRWWSGTTALGAALLPRWYYHDDMRYYRAVKSAWGLRAGRGSSNSPIPIHSSSPRRLSLSCPRTAPVTLAGSPSPAALLGFRPVGSFPTTSSCHGTRFLPKSLSLWFVLLLLGFWGDACCS